MGNLKNNKVASEMPTDTSIQEGQLQLVNDSGTLYMVTKHNGTIVKSKFS